MTVPVPQASNWVLTSCQLAIQGITFCHTQVHIAKLFSYVNRSSSKIWRKTTKNNWALKTYEQNNSEWQKHEKHMNKNQRMTTEHEKRTKTTTVNDRQLSMKTTWKIFCEWPAVISLMWNAIRIGLLERYLWFDSGNTQKPPRQISSYLPIASYFQLPNENITRKKSPPPPHPPSPHSPTTTTRHPESPSRSESSLPKVNKI